MEPWAQGKGWHSEMTAVCPVALLCQVHSGPERSWQQVGWWPVGGLELSSSEGRSSGWESCQMDGTGDHCHTWACLIRRAQLFILLQPCIESSQAPGISGVRRGLDSCRGHISSWGCFLHSEAISPRASEGWVGQWEPQKSRMLPYLALAA